MRSVCLLLAVLLCAVVEAQSIVVSGGRQSIVVSGMSRPKPEEPVFDTVEPVITEQEADKAGADTGETTRLRSEISELREQLQKLREALQDKQSVSKQEPVKVPVVQKSELPVLEVWTIENCPPCAMLKSDIASGKLYGFGIRWMSPSGPRPFPGGFPQVRVNGRAWIGWDANTLQQVRAYGLSAQSQSAPVVVQPQPVRQPQLGRIVDTPWGRIDLDTYRNDACNCPMCRGIRAMQRQRWSSMRSAARSEEFVVDASLPAGQQPTPDLVLQDGVELLQMPEDGVLADIGCGDGRVLIAAVQRYGCSGVGVEIDPDVADKARRNVEQAGLSDRIRIVTGDALQFRPSEYGVTAVFAYLYPDLLEKLAPVFSQVPVVVTPFHCVPGMENEMVRKGDVWLKRV